MADGDHAPDRLLSAVAHDLGYACGLLTAFVAISSTDSSAITALKKIATPFLDRLDAEADAIVCERSRALQNGAAS